MLEAPGSEACLAERITVLASFKRGEMPPSAACDGRSNTPYLATSRTDVPRLLGPLGAQENPHPQSKEAGRRKQITEKEHFSGPAQRSR